MLLMHFRYCPLRLPTPGMQLYTIHAFRLTRDGHRTAYIPRTQWKQKSGTRRAGHHLIGTSAIASLTIVYRWRPALYLAHRNLRIRFLNGPWPGIDIDPG